MGAIVANAFVQRRPWAAAVVTAIFDPMIGMFYLNRGWLGLFYLVFEIALIFGAWSVYPNGAFSLAANDLATLPVLAIRFIGTIHTFIISRHWLPDTNPKWYARWYALVIIAVLPLITALLIRAFLLRSFDISAVSMSPNLNRGDYFLASLRVYHGSKPQRGDVIVFFAPQYRVNYVKRIVGLPGDHIQMKKGVIFINGQAVKQQRAGKFVLPCGASQCSAAKIVETLPNGRRYDTLDLVEDGLLDNTNVFVVPAHSYFVLGDNRDNSDDSRAGLGFVAERNIAGKAWMKFRDARGWTWMPVR